MQWTADNTPSTIQSKSLKLRELFAKVANASLDKGFSKEESIFAGTNAVKIEERKNQPAKVKAPKLPSHVEALRSYTNPFEVVSKAEEIIEVQSTVKSAEFDADGHLILSMSDGKKIKTKNKAAEQNIEQNIAIAPNVQLLSSDDSINIVQDGQAFDIGTASVINPLDHLDFNQATTSTNSVGRLKWNDVDGTLEFGLKGGNVNLQIGQEEVVHILNNTTSNFTDLQVIRITGASGQRMTGALAQANAESTSAATFAIVTEPILKNQVGFATVSGLVRDVNTSAFNEGDALYLSPTTAGGITNVKPIAPNHMVLVGWCVRSNQNNGVIYVHVQNGYELDELHNVKINGVTNGQVLAYDSALGLWKNTDAGTGSGSVTSVAGKTGDVTLDKSDVGLSNVDNTADSAKSVASASTLTTARLINGVSFNGSADITIADSTKQPLDSDLTAIAALTGTSGLLKKTATNTWTLDTNNYVTSSGVTSVNATGTVSGLTFSGTVTSTGDLTLSGQLEVLPSDFQSQAANLVLASPNSTTGKPTFRALVTSDIPNLDASKITSGTIDAARLPSYIDDVLEFSNLASFPSTGETGKLYVALDTNKVYRWSGSTYIFITSGAVDSVAGKTGVVTLNSSDVGLGNVENKSSATIRGELTSGNITTALGFTPYNATNPNGYITSSGSITGNAASATVLQTARTINGVSFDGSANINIATKLPILNRLNSVVNVTIANALLAVTNRAGSTINVAVG